MFAFPDEHPAAVFEVQQEARSKLRRLRPPVKAHGGKYYLAPQIVPILLSAPGNPTEYLEPCAFGASVFLAMPRHDREILGDINPGVVALWQVLSRVELAEVLQERLSSIDYNEATFEAAKSEPLADKTVDRAEQMVVRSRFSRGGLGTTFAWSDRLRGGKPGDENAWDTFRETQLPEIIKRTRGVEVINEACWLTVWASREKAQRLIYADPPYMRSTRTAKEAYGPFEMTQLQHFWLVAALRAHAGPAAISGYRCYDYDRWLNDWQRYDFEMPNNAGQNKRKQRRIESLWCNW